MAAVIAPWNLSRAQEGIPAGVCRFALALPEREGPLTLGVFSPQGNLVRLLYKDASIETIPAGLNGLIISWDGKDDAGSKVSEGTYRACGLVHGPLAISALPQRETKDLSGNLPGELESIGINFSPLLPRNRIVVMAARDALLNDKRLLLALTVRLQGEEVLMEAEGLPLFSLPLEAGRAKPEVVLRHGRTAGEAELILRRPEGSEIFTLSGLDTLVPLDAGTLEMPSDTFHPAPEQAGAGEPHS
jgi:hypothetical protein